MPVPCPCCKAANDAGPTCRRCKADLALLFAVEAQRDSALEEARQMAAASRYREARTALDRAAQLRHGDDVLKMRACVLLLSRDFAAARAAYDELTTTANPP